MAAPALVTTARGWGPRIGLAAAVALLVILFTQKDFIGLDVFERLELASIDYRFQLRGTDPRIKDSPHVVIVEISEESYKSLPQRWPWPRSYYARLIRNLKDAGAQVVGIDIILSGGDVHSPDHDADLRNAIRETKNVVLAGKIEVTREKYVRSTADENFGNLFFGVDSSLGIVNVRSDDDGIYRRYTPFFETTRYSRTSGSEVVRVPTFGFAVLNKHFALPPHFTPENEPDRFVYGQMSLPKVDAASLLLNFYGPSGTFLHLKFADVIDDETLTTTEEKQTGEEINTFSDPDFGYKYDGTFKNKIVLVGSTIPEDHDILPVAMARGQQQGDNLMYGVELHANLIENVLRNDFLTRQSEQSEILFALFLTFVTFIVSSWLRGLRTGRHYLVELGGFLFSAMEIIGILAAAFILFSQQRYVLTITTPILAVLGGYIASTAYHFVTERKQRVLIKSMFSTYLDPVVVNELISNPEKLKLGGDRRELTVLFSDIAGFTTISERMSPEQTVSLLNEYLHEMTTIIFRNKGTLDKFEGDAVMAFWGAPIPQDNHAFLACKSALEMQRALVQIRNLWAEQGKPVINIRIGLNTGDMVVGNMGGAGKFDYTVIGDSVNLASRLEGVNKVYGTGLLVSERTYELVSDQILGREMGLITVKGRSEPLKTFELIQLRDEPVDPGLREFLDAYASGLKLYRAHQWSAAKVELQRALQLRADDRPAQVFIERAEHFLHNPPPADWDGVFEMKTK